MIQSGRDTKVFTGTMDQDTEARYLGPANYRYLLNGRTAINSQGTFGAVEDVMGNVLVPNPNLPPGQNKVIGSYEDIAGQSCIYFVYNNNGFHGIYRWFANSPLSPNGFIETIYRVSNPAVYNQFNPNPLDFQFNGLITGVNLVDNLLCWTDSLSGPKMLNIDRANVTNKRKKFNIYFNRALFDKTITPIFANGIDFTINIYQENIIAPIASLTWTDLPVSSIQNSVALLVAAYQASIPFQAVATITNNINWVDIEINTPGVYTVEFTNNAPAFPPFLAGYVTPDNFYPDATATTVSYNPTSYQLFERIKYPPFCNTTGFFDPLSSPLQSFSFDLSPYNYTIPVPGFNGNVSSIYYNDGITNVNDPYGYVVPGAPTYGGIRPNGTGPAINAQAYLTNPTASPVTLNITSTISCALDTTGTAITPPFTNIIRVFLGPKNNPVLGNSILIGQLNPTGGNNPFTGTFNTNITLAPGAQYIIYTQWFFPYIVPGGGPSLVQGPNANFALPASTFNVQVISNKYYNPVSELYPLFRAKYIYDDEQHSVYGAISPTVVNDTVGASKVILNFEDNRLIDVNLACDIKKVVLAVSLDNNVTWFDFAELLPYQWIGHLNQKYVWENKDALLAVPAAESTLLFHNVPLKSKSQEYIDDRIWDGAITTGYDTIQLELDTSVLYDDITQPPWLSLLNNQPYLSISRWKRGYIGQIGIVYYDDADRKTAVCLDDINSRVSIPDYDDPTFPNTYDYNPAYIRLGIYNDPPDWAVKYHVVRTHDLSQLNYLYITAGGIDYVDAEDNVVLPTFARFIRVDLQNISYYNENSNKGAKLIYTFVQGDRIKFLKNAAGARFNKNDYQIEYAIGNYVYINYDGVLTNLNAGSLIELYTPTQESEKLLFYEFGECHAIETINVGGSLVRRHAGSVQNQIPGAAPAILDLKTGDVWYRNRQVFYNTAGPFIPGQLANNYIQFLSDRTPSDYSELICDNNGRVNSIDIKGRLYQPTGIVFSNKYISNTDINGLNAVEPLNTQQYSTVYGDIRKMQVVNNDVLKLIFGNSYQLSIYVSQGVIRQAQGGTPLVSISDQVAGNSHIIQRTLGTINPESVVVNDEGDMFGYDENEGVVWISSGNGLIQISDRGMKSVFKRYSNERKSTLAVSETPAIYDLYHDEYIITLNTISNAPGPTKSFPGYTIAYNKQKGGWTSYYSFLPDYYGRVRDYVVSFVKGQLYVHDRSNIAKEFYGTQYNRELTYVSNKDFPKVRDFKAISVNGIGLNDVPSIRILPFEGYPNGMFSLLTKRFFKVLEGVQYAYFQKDRLTPGMQANQVNAMANGRNLKGQVLEVTLVNDDTTKSSIYSSEIIYFYSEHS